MKTVDLLLLAGIVAAGLALVRIAKGNQPAVNFTPTTLEKQNPYTQTQSNGVTYL